MMKLGILLVFIALFSTIATAADLGDYPGFFLSKGKPDVFIIVGNEAPATHVIAQSKLALALGNEFGQPLSGKALLASDVEDISSINAIILGNACINEISSEVLGNQRPCSSGIGAGEAKLQLFESSEGKIHIVANAYSDKGLAEAVNALIDYRDFDFKGDEYSLDIEGEEVQIFENEAPEAEEKAPEKEIKGIKQETEKAENEASLDEPAEQPEPVKEEEAKAEAEETGFFSKIADFFRKLFSIFRG